jgi:hypothetical protein
MGTAMGIGIIIIFSVAMWGIFLLSLDGLIDTWARLHGFARKPGKDRRLWNWVHNLNHLLAFVFDVLLIDERDEETRTHIHWELIHRAEWQKRTGQEWPRKWFWPHEYERS